jgi:hypothetical protein
MATITLYVKDGADQIVAEKTVDDEMGPGTDYNFYAYVFRTGCQLRNLTHPTSPYYSVDSNGRTIAAKGCPICGGALPVS